jgi:hypothetical protein
MTQRKSRCPCSSSLFVGCLCAAFAEGFVWDDQALILRDPLIRSWQLIPEGFTHFLFTDASASDFYRPLQRPPTTWITRPSFSRRWDTHPRQPALALAAASPLFYFAEEFLATCKMAPRAGFGSRSWRR